MQVYYCSLNLNPFNGIYTHVTAFWLGFSSLFNTLTLFYLYIFDERTSQIYGSSLHFDKSDIIWYEILITISFVIDHRIGIYLTVTNGSHPNNRKYKYDNLVRVEYCCARAKLFVLTNSLLVMSGSLSPLSRPATWSNKTCYFF